MNLIDMSEADFADELIDAFKVRSAFTDDYEPFEAADVIERSMSVFLDAVARIEGQLDDDLAYSSDDDSWRKRARGAMRRYKREVARLKALDSARRRRENEATRERNRANYTDWSREVHDLLEEVAIRCEEAGGSLDGLALPANADGAEPMPVEEWLDLREQKREAKRAGETP